ncbi:MAG: hypothetical protein D6679_01305 [Candidatus Hydrogenedentota bacterium]|nr:MAG: hypothetical protein D6679_01305 [Candidatus Hydrogenedentota bacterium]
MSSAVSEVVTAVKTVGRRETYLRSAGAGAFAPALRREIERYRRRVAALESFYALESKTLPPGFPARVLRTSARNFPAEFLVEIGEGNRTAPGDLAFALTADTVLLLGTVEETAENLAVIRTQWSERTRWAARVEGGEEEYVFRGGWPSPELLFVPAHRLLSRETKVFTSSASGFVPGGLFLGTVKEIEAAGIFQKVLLAPRLSPQVLEYLWVSRR